jgi:hypothetical protein
VTNNYVEGRRGWVRLHEKSNKVVTMPCHQKLEEYLDEYVKVAGFADLPTKAPFFRRHGGDLENSLGGVCPLSMPGGWCVNGPRQWGLRAGLGITLSGRPGLPTTFKTGGKIETAQQMAGHESSRTTGLYDRRDDELSLDEIERISI